MIFETALRTTEILLALVLLLQSLEHVVLAQRQLYAGYETALREEQLFLVRGALAFVLLLGFAPGLVGALLLISTAFYLRRYAGAFNGGADRMGILILICLTAAHLAPTERLAELAFGYLAMQLILSYFISGWVKITKPAWRSGEALRDVFLFSAYPVSEALRGLAEKRRLLLVGAWAVMLLEVLFPLALLWRPALIAALALTAAFHGANALLFGLNRFFWTWLTAYPCLLWLQSRLTGAEPFL